MARTHTFRNKQAIVKALNELPTLSRFLKLQLVGLGYVTTAEVHTGGRGRPAYDYQLTGKGRGLVALSANWGKKTDNLRNQKAA